MLDGAVWANYRFLHDLYHEALYQRLGARRRRRWHLRIGELLEASYRDRTPEIATELALHFARGWDKERAATYYRYAADMALRRFAYQETIDHAAKGLHWLAS